MSQKEREYAVSPCRSEDYPEWYQAVIKAADMAGDRTTRHALIIN